MFSYLIEQLNLKEGTEEVSLDNWEISTLFYDLTVDEGKTPLTEINQDASLDGLKDGEYYWVKYNFNVKYQNSSGQSTSSSGSSYPNIGASDIEIRDTFP